MTLTKKEESVLTMLLYKKSGGIHIGDLPFREEDSFAIFKSLPEDIQLDAAAYGGSDTEVGDRAFEHLCKAYFNMTCEEYYKSDVAKEYYKSHEKIKFVPVEK